MRFADRSLSQILKALRGPEHYHAALQMFRVYRRYGDGYRRYLLGRGDYPADVEVKTPMGNVRLRAYSRHDMLTINEIFCREDYFASGNEEIFVDFGANIGVSAAYFLTRGPRGFAYLYEPVPRNVERLRDQLSFLDRFCVEEVAVGTREGTVSFGVEDSGRYGGIGVREDKQIDVRCVDSNDVLRAVIAKHGKIDILKIDIEGLEGEVVSRIPSDLRPKIQTIYAEWTPFDNPMAGTHRCRQYGKIAQFRRLTV